MKDQSFYQEPFEPTSESRMGRQLLVSCVGLMYLIFGMESYLGHYLVIGKFGWPVYVPLVLSIIGILFSVVEMVKPGQNFTAVFKTFMTITIVVGFAGFYFHLSALPVSTGLDLTATTWLAVPPLPAPLSFILPGVMGLVATRGSSSSR
ncbi:MAG: hypothetical protein ACYCX4_02940 [Bacillota bacterium]